MQDSEKVDDDSSLDANPIIEQPVGEFAESDLTKSAPRALATRPDLRLSASDETELKVPFRDSQPRHKEPPIPIGLGFHRNEFYELVVRSMEKQGQQAKLDITIENRSPRDLKVLCLMQETILKDDRGAVWPQSVEENRDGLCMRGIELSPREKEQTVLIFTAPPDASASPFTLHYHEKSPRRDAAFTIDGLMVESGVVAAPTSP